MFTFSFISSRTLLGQLNTTATIKLLLKNQTHKYWMSKICRCWKSEMKTKCWKHSPIRPAYCGNRQGYWPEMLALFLSPQNAASPAEWSQQFLVLLILNNIIDAPFGILALGFVKCTYSWILTHITSIWFFSFYIWRDKRWQLLIPMVKLKACVRNAPLTWILQFVLGDCCVKPELTSMAK